METAIYIFQRIRTVLGAMEIKCTRSNLDILLGCMQLCDKGEEVLNKAIADAKKSENHESNTSDISDTSNTVDV